MSQYNTSSAHQYAPAEIVAPKPVAKRRYRVIENQEEKGLLAFVTAKTVIMFLAIVGVIFFMLYNQARINEVNDEISNVTGSITQMDSEYVRMQSSLESTLSLRSVAKVAEQELGLQHLDQYQIEYVCIYEDDYVEIMTTTGPESFSDQVETFVANVVTGVRGILG